MKYNSAAAVQHIDDEIRTNEESELYKGSPLSKILSDTVEFVLPKGFKKPGLIDKSAASLKLNAKVASNFSFGNQATKQFNRDDFFPDLYLQKQKRDLNLVRKEKMKEVKDIRNEA